MYIRIIEMAFLMSFVVNELHRKIIQNLKVSQKYI